MPITAYKKKNGQTAYAVSEYLGKENGVSKYFRKKGFKTKAKARAAILQAQEDFENPEKVQKQMTVEAVAKLWLKEYADTVQESTYIKTYRNIKNHIYPALGDQRIASLTPLQMQEQVNAWSKKLVYGRKLKGVMNNICKYAIRYGYLTTNPMDSVTTLVKKQTEDTTDFYTKEELQTFLTYVDETGDIEKIAFFRLLAFTGCRKGELLALQWSDWTDSTLSINKGITRGWAGEEIGKTKTASSNRLISLDPKTVDILKKYRKERPNNLYLFEGADGKPMPSSLPRKWILQVLKGKELRPIKIHGFRHTHASLCFEAGMTLKQVQYRLGHSDLKTTMNIYTHITKTAKDDIGQRFANYIDF